MQALRASSRRVLCCVLVLAFASVSLAAQSKLSKADTRKLREGFAEALAGDERAGKKLVTAAKDWEKEHDFDSLLAALRAGPLLPKGAPKPRGKGRNAERFEEFGTVTTGFTFTAGKDTFRYAVDVPKGYDAEVPAPVILDPGHGAAAQSDQEAKAGYLGYCRHRAAAAGIENALVVRTEIIEQIGAGGVMGERPEDEVSAVFDAFFRDLCSRFAVDLDRVWVTGLSQTGFWAWQLGITRADRFAGIAPMRAVTWGTSGCLPNLVALATYVLHGDALRRHPRTRLRAHGRARARESRLARHVRSRARAAPQKALFGELHECRVNLDHARVAAGLDHLGKAWDTSTEDRRHVERQRA